jgi:PPIC-type PPIASE domain
MRKQVPLLIFIGWATMLQAQQSAIDFGVASEVVRNMMSAETSQNILASTNLMANYRNFALEQELAQEAARRGLTERIDVQRSLEDIRREVLIRALRVDITRQAETPSEEQIKSEFEKLKDQLVMPPTLKLDVYSISGSQTQAVEKAKLLLKSETNAVELLTKRGFVHVTGQLAEPWFSSNQVSEYIWKRLSEVKAGEIESFPDGNNILVIKKLDARESRKMTLDEARSGLTRRLMAGRQNALWDEFVTKKSRELGF